MERAQERANQTVDAGEHTPSLRVFSGERAIFLSSGRWLHPLFELEEFLQTSKVAAEECSIEDKIIGKAAAFLIVNMGFRNVHGETMSRLAEAVFVAQDVRYTFATMVERIDCQTETLLAGTDDIEAACHMLRRRAGRERIH